MESESVIRLEDQSFMSGSYRGDGAESETSFRKFEDNNASFMSGASDTSLMRVVDDS